MDVPVWFNRKVVNEILFCEEFLSEHPMVYVKGSFFTVEHGITDERELKKLIYEKIRNHVQVGISKKVDSLLGVLRSEAFKEDLPIQADRIHVANANSKDSLQKRQQR